MNREDLKSIKFIIEKSENSIDSISGAITDVSSKQLKDILKSELTACVLRKSSLNNRISEISDEINIIKGILDNLENKDYQLNTEFATKLGL